MKKYFFSLILILMLLIALVYQLMPQRAFLPDEKIFFTSLGQPRSLDPAFAADYASCVMVLSLFDTLYQYDYEARPYRVKPSMLAHDAVCNDTGTSWHFTLRDDLYFISDPCFDNDSHRVTSHDVRFSLLRLADARLVSPGYHLLRGKIKGIEKFRQATAQALQNDFAPYLIGCEGIQVVSDTEFYLHLAHPEPRLPYYLAMSYTAIVSEIAIKTYGEKISEHPVGSGPFALSQYQKSYRIELCKNSLYRPQSSTCQLPYIDKIICYLVQDPQPAWLMFLNGDLDVSAINKDQMDVVGTGGVLPPALKSRGIDLQMTPELQINYIGFSFTDPKLASNLNLRKAISLAYNKPKREVYYNGLIRDCNGPLLPGLAGHDSTWKNPYSIYNLTQAKHYMQLAGYPDGIDSATQKPLTLTFDLPETGPAARQVAEMMVDDMKEIGIRIIPILNSKPKFLEKNRAGQMQLFRFNWVFDYPDAENIFQLYYGPNAGGCNRIFYHNEIYDACYEKAIRAPAHDAIKHYQALEKIITEECPWIFESQPLSFRLIHKWVENYLPHDFAFDRWKYIQINPECRQDAKKQFTPLSMDAFSTTR